MNNDPHSVGKNYFRQENFPVTVTYTHMAEVCLHLIYESLYRCSLFEL